MSIDWKKYLISQGAIFQEASLTGFSGQTESHLDNIVSVLSNRSFLTIAGPDTQKFLQGQISVHMDQLLESQHKPGVACTPKGRMYTSFRLLNSGEKYIWSLDKSIAEHTVTTLGKYAVFFKSELEIDDNLIALGLSGPSCMNVLEELSITIPEHNQSTAIEGGHLLQVESSTPRFEFWINSESLPLWWEKLTKLCSPASASAWQLLDIQNVQPSVTAELLEKYIPQHLNIPSLGGVSFRKGCYTGQEIVTRMQSLGQQKSRTYHLRFAGQIDIECGQTIFDDNGKGIGEVLTSEYGVSANNTELLAVIRIDTAEQGKAYLDSEQQQGLEILPIPYPLDSKAELQQ